MTKKHKFGFVAIVGKPNAGKSTLLNTFLSRKIAIVSNRPETTRDNIRGVFTAEDGQAVFIDTPGIHKPHQLLGKIMVNKASDSLLSADLILFIVDMASGLSDADYLILSKIKEAKSKAIAVLNKIDIIRKSKILPVIDMLRNEYPFDEFIPVSALSGDNAPLLRDKVFAILPAGKNCYPASQITDKGDIFFAAEAIREKVLLLTREEVPHSAAVVIEKFLSREEKAILDIDATIYVERESQKSIVVGRRGSLAKEIATLSRVELEDMFKKKVFLQLWVRVIKNWRKDGPALRRLGIN